MGKYRMYEPWGYQEANNYISKKSVVEDDLAESKKNDEQELKDIEELKKSKVDNVSYEKNENKIVFFANEKEIASIDTTDFIKDGMIESVELDGTVLKITFNTESGKEEIDVDFKDIISGDSFYTKDEVDSKLDEKANKSDIPSMDEYAKTADVQTEIANAVSGKADSSDVEAIEAQITPISSDIATLKLKDDELQEAIDLKASQADFEALSNNVYTKQESDDKFLTEHQDISALATKEEVESGMTDLWSSLNLAAEKIETKADTDAVYTKTDVDELLLTKENEIYNLTKIVGDMGGAVTYELPSAAGKSFNTLMGNNGTVKLTDNVISGRFGPGVTAKNKVKLNLNGHDLIFSGLTISSSYAAIMSRGTQEITIGGKGTIDCGEGICIEANGADSVINLTSSTTTYKTNRNGGELIYCYAGTINITNGIFRNDGEEKKFTLNCYDANYKNGTAKIVVTGGKFYDFDPGNNTAEGPNTSFLAEGYHTEASTVTEEGVEHTVYTVKAD